MARSFSGVDLDAAKGMLADVKLPSFAENRAFFDPKGAWQLPTRFTRRPRASGARSASSTTSLSPIKTADTAFPRWRGRVLPAGSQVAAQPEFAFEAPARAAAAPILSKKVSIYFPTGSSTLDENAKAVLDIQVVELAATFGSAYLRVAGNTDNVGSRDANMRLSRARADAVSRYLVTRGFERNKFDVVGNGPDRPVASNDTDDGRAKNRRTDFEVIPR